MMRDHPHELAGVAGADVGLDEAARHAGIGALDEHELARAHKRLRVGTTRCGGHLAHRAAALDHDLGRNLIGHVGRRRARTLGVAEHVHLGKADLAAGLERGRKVLVRLAREANDEVAREREVRHGHAGAIDDRAVLGDGVGPAHAAQRSVAASLERHVEELRHAPAARRHDAQEPGRDARRLHG